MPSLKQSGPKKKKKKHTDFIYIPQKNKKVVIVNFVLFCFFIQTINMTDRLQVSMCLLIYSVQAKDLFVQ